jgi:hypothetical protein
LEQSLTGLTEKISSQAVLTELNSELATCEQFLTDLALKIRTVEISKHEEVNRIQRTKQVYQIEN